MKKIRTSIPTIVSNADTATKNRLTKLDPSSSVAVFQHNNLVQARYSLTLQEKRIMLWLISQVQPDDEDFKEHNLSVREFMDLLELTGKANYKELQKITLGLMKKVLVIKRPEEQRTTQVNWINYADYREKEGVITLSFSDKMQPFLLNLKKSFTAIKLSDLMQFSSIHAIRIYELLKQYEKIRERILTIEEIKECCGVKGKLTRYSDFKDKILLIAQREINQKSDIKFDFEPIKSGRRFVAIKFIIRENIDYAIHQASHNRALIEQKTPERKPPIFDALREFGFGIAATNKLIKEYSEEVIKDAISAVDLQIYRCKVRNAKAMLKTAIKEKWHPEKFQAKKEHTLF